MGTYEDLKAILDYMQESEEKHYEESGKPNDHIFVKVKRVRDWFDSAYCPLVPEEELGD